MFQHTDEDGDKISLLQAGEREFRFLIEGGGDIVILDEIDLFRLGRVIRDIASERGVTF